MQYTFTVSVDDLNELKEFMLARDNSSRIYNALQKIRNRLKHGDPSDKEIEMLEYLRETLFYE